ncbi:MAG TPA: glycosyltransferase family 9 protein [Chitinophagaceae bacterium]|nr:glycosyltransferase family 9 protein [Chitinophagaceae bacterium]
MKFLIIRFSSIGDIVLTTPVFRCLKKQVPGAEIHFVTKQSFKIVTATNPYIDKFFYFDNDLDLLIDELKQENYDYIIDLHKNFRSIKIRQALKKKTYAVNKLSVQKFILTRLKINIMPGVHITQRSLNTLRRFGVKNDGLGLDYFIPEGDCIKTEDLPTSHLSGFIAIVIGANHFTKKLPVYKLKELCSLLDYPVILLGGKEEVSAGEEIAAADPVKIYNACGKFNLNESADIVRRSHVVISHDTGLQYIACAFKKPVVAVWGSTSPELDVEPYYGEIFLKKFSEPPYKNIYLKLWCQPCSKYGTKKCPLGHFNCMNKMPVKEIAESAMSHLKRW